MLATYTTLTSNVVVTAIQASAMDAQIDATRQLIALNSHALEILNYQLHKGYASGVDVAAQESQLAQVTATLPPLIKQSDQLHHLLAVLTGRFPNEAPARAIRTVESAIARRSAGQHACATGGAASGCAPGAGESACRQRADRNCHREPVAQYHSDR